MKDSNKDFNYYYYYKEAAGHEYGSPVTHRFLWLPSKINCGGLQPLKTCSRLTPGKLSSDYYIWKSKY